MHGRNEALYPAPRLLAIGSRAADDGAHLPIHQHPEWELVYYRRGRARATIGDHTYDGVAGVLLTTPPRTPHAEFAMATYASTYLAVDAPADQPWPRLAFDDADHSLGRIIAALAREAAALTVGAPSPAGAEPAGALPGSAATTGGAAGHRHMVDLLVAELDVLLRRAAAKRAPSSAERLIAQAEWLIEQRHAEPLRITQIAAELGASATHLRSRFVALRGHTMQDHLHAVRLRHALGELRDSTRTLETIAERTGFSSASHLSRRVKEATGLTPGEVRRLAHAGRHGTDAQPAGRAG